jgi:hypothetical protein
MGDNVKQVAIRGDAVSAYKGKTRKSRGPQDGGFDVPSSGQIQLRQANVNSIRGMVGKMSGGVIPPSSLPPPATQTLVTGPGPGLEKALSPGIPKVPPQAGGKPKLILEPKKRSMKKLHLAPATIKSSGMAHGQAAHTGKRSVSKTRKIRVSLSGMKKRLTRAKEIHKESRNSDIADIKKKLIEAKLIKPRPEGKPDSTEYDMLLRKTYEDYMLLRGRAL